MNNFLKDKSNYRAEPAKTQGFTAYQLDLAKNKKVLKNRQLTIITDQTI